MRFIADALFFVADRLRDAADFVETVAINIEAGLAVLSAPTNLGDADNDFVEWGPLDSPVPEWIWRPTVAGSGWTTEWGLEWEPPPW